MSGDAEAAPPPEIAQGLARLEAAATEGEAGAATPGEADSAAPEPESWEPVTVWALDVLIEILPKTLTWTPAARAMVTKGGAGILNRYFPGGPGAWESWGPWAQLLAGIGVFGFANYAELKRINKAMRDERRKADSSGGKNAQRQDTEHAPGDGAGAAPTGVRPEG